MGKREMTEEGKAALLAGKAQSVKENHERKDASRIDFGNISCYILDEFNWVVEKDNDESTRACYPDLQNCIKHVLRMEIGIRNSKKATDILTAIKEAETHVCKELTEIQSLRCFSLS